MKAVSKTGDKTEIWDFPGGLVAQKPPFNAGDTSSIPGPEDPTQLSLNATTPEPTGCYY